MERAQREKYGPKNGGAWDFLSEKYTFFFKTELRKNSYIIYTMKTFDEGTKNRM